MANIYNKTVKLFMPVVWFSLDVIYLLRVQINWLKLVWDVSNGGRLFQSNTALYWKHYSSHFRACRSA